MKKIFVTLAIICVAVCAGIFVHSWRQTQKAPPIEEPVNKYDRMIYDSLTALTGEDELHLAEITVQNALEAIKQIKTPDKYYAIFEVERFSSDASVTVKNTVWTSGAKYRVETVGDIKKTVICDGERVKIINADGDFKIIDAAGDFSYADQTGLADIEYFTENAENELITARFAKLNGRGKDNIIYVEFYYPRFNQLEMFYVSADYGVVLAAQTYVDDQLTYRLTTSEFTADYSTDGTVFDVSE